MKVVVSMDSFKGSLTSMEAGMAFREGALRAAPFAKVVVKPLADGGEGTAEALVSGIGGEWISLEVCGPLGDRRTASYGWVEEKKLAVMEMAAAAGLTLIPEEKRNALYTTTYGVGEMIRDALKRGARQILLGPIDIGSTIFPAKRVVNVTGNPYAAVPESLIHASKVYIPYPGKGCSAFTAVIAVSISKSCTKGLQHTDPAVIGGASAYAYNEIPAASVQGILYHLTYAIGSC